MLKKARALSLQYTKSNQHASAAYWAEKVMILSGGDIEDVCLYVQSLFANHEYRRAVNLLENTPQLQQCSGLRYLAAKCLSACKSWEEVVSMLTPQPDEEEEEENDSDKKEEEVVLETLGNVKAASCVMLGRAYEALGNIQEAINSYKEALVEDVFCIEALDCLYNMHALTASDEESLISNLPFKKHCSVEEERMLRYLYHSKCRYYKETKFRTPPESSSSLSSSIDVLSNTAETLFNQMNVRECLNQTKQIMKQDSYHFPTILIHIPCCIITNATKDLYTLGHDLVKHFPTLPISWYAVSAYYFSTSKHAQARRYLTKSINLDAHFAHSHLLFGLSFTSEGEHDQAIAAFSHAARYLRGSHVPLMYLGKEYFVTNALPISTSFFKNALSLAPNDPILLQEVGVVLVSNGNYEKAEKYFRCTVTLLSNIDPHTTLPVWEPVYNNLGHVLRKQGKHQDAIDCHMKALQLCPNESSTLTAIAFTYLLMEDFNKVIEFCNTSLRIKREDLVTIDLLQTAIKELANQPFELDPLTESTLDKAVYTIEDTRVIDVAVSSGESAMQTD